MTVRKTEYYHINKHVKDIRIEVSEYVTAINDGNFDRARSIADKIEDIGESLALEALYWSKGKWHEQA